MKKGGGKAKGSGFERQIAKDIIKAFKPFKVEQRDCWRSVLSGGHPMSSGDLEMSRRMEELFPYSVECKFRKEIRWENFLLGNAKAEETKWIAQVLDGVKKRPELSPLLVLKANHCKALVICTRGISSGPFLNVGNDVWRVAHWTTFLKNAVMEATKRCAQK